MKSSSNNKKTPATKKSSVDSFSDKPVIKSSNLFPVVGIGASAGGLNAFKKLLKAIPEDSGMAYVLVQHLDPSHESMLPELLQKVTPIPVLEITDDIKVHPDHIYVIPSNKMMVATDGILMLAPRPPKSKTERNLPIDLFFTSLAEVHQEHAIGVVLSGTASDGTQGLRAIKDQGGLTFAQDEASAEYEGMPHSAALAGVVDFILPPEEIPQKLLEVTSKIVLTDEELQNIPKQEEDIFKQILSLLRIRKGIDFTYYKQTTVRRRILRRMLVNKNEETAAYLKFLSGNIQEQDLLYQDMLIPVTSFFRDKKVFDNLCDNVFPAILKNKVPGEITRIWVAGCSTGQEVYSFAICFREFLGEHHERIQIFGTDLSEPAITKARAGIYEKTEVDALSPQRLKEYFTKNNGGYQVNKSIRDMCVFAHHNFLKDPPFGKMDCISCRNVLIYMEPYLQKKALTTFHYALNPNGFLLLGKSETTGGVPALFADVEKNDKLFSRKDVPGRFMQVASQRSEQILNRHHGKAKSEIILTDFQKTADDILLSKFMPAGVVVNEAMDIVQFRGNTSNYLEHAPGKPSHNLLMMAKSSLAFELRNVLHKAKTDNAAVVKENIPLHINGGLRNISIEAVPLPNTLEPYYLVLFHDYNLNDADGLVTGSRKKASPKVKQDEKDIRILMLEQELSQLREDMRSITEEQEAANEELQSANEELLSGSEELQSLNEELETSKEELQSTNEELTVLNHELIGLNDQVTDARNYSESVVATLYQPLLVLDKHLRVKTANKAFYKTFNVNEQETEGVLVYDLGNRQWNIPELRTLLEEILPQKKQITDYEVSHNFLSIGERIILLSGLEITREKKEEKLILLSIEDITERKLAQKRLEESEHSYHMMLMNSPFAFSIMKGKEMVVTLANNLMKNFWGKGQQVEGKTLLQVLPELIDQPFPAMIYKVFTSGEPVNANEILARLNRNGIVEERYFNIVYQPLFEADKTISGVITIAHEVTNQVLARKQTEDSNKRYNMMLLQSPFAFAILKGKDMVVTLANDSVKEMWGKGKKVEGKSLFEVIPEIKDQGFPELLNEVYSTGIPYSSIESLVRLQRNGKMEDAYFNFAYQPYREADETISGVVIIATEVTPLAILNKKIKASEEKFKLLVLQAPVAICVLRGENYVIEVINNGMTEMWDRTLEEALNKPAFDVLPEFRDQGLKELLDNVYNTGERTVVQEFPLTINRHGKFENIFVKFVYEPLHEADGSISGVMCLAHEITEQVEARKKVEESEEQFSTLAENMENLAWLADEDGFIYWYNKRWYDYTGTTLEEMQGWGWQKAHHPDHVDRVIDFVKDAWHKNEAYELTFPLRGADGEYKWFLTRAYPIADEQGKVMRWIGTNTNIDEQKKAAVEINYRKALLEAHNEASIDGILLVDAKGKIISYNHKFIEIWNMPPEIVQAKDDDAALAFAMQQLVHPEQFIEKVKYLYEHPTETSKDLLEFTDGKIVERYGYAVIATDGSYYAWSWTFRDITIQKLYERNIKQSEEHFRFMANSMPHKVWTADASGKKNYFNQTLLDYTGFTFEELEGDGWHKAIHPEDMENNKPAWEESMRTGKDYETENRLLRKDGKYLWHLTRAVAIKDVDGNIKTWVGSKTEIQEQQELKEELEKAVTNRTNQLQEVNKVLKHTNEELLITKEKLISEYSRSLIEASPDPFITISTLGRIMDMNEAMVKVTDTSREQLTGTNFSDYFTDPEKAMLGCQQVFSKGFVADYPLTILDDKLTPVLFNGSVYKDGQGNVQGAVLVARDMTVQKRIEKELTEAKVFAEEAVKSKQQFLSNMSHEIRTPMNAIIGFSRLVLKTALTEKQQEYLSAIKISGDTLIVLINDILDLAKVDAGKMTFEQIPFSMAGNISAMLHLFETKTAELNIALVKEYDHNIPALLLGDPVRLNQVMLNLLSNAVKFTKQGKITVGVKMINEDENKATIRFTVKDTGIGIEENKLESIFQNFQQASTGTARLYGGTGLGLAIVKQLVEAQGGNVEVISKLGKGAAFSFTLNFLKTTHTAEPESAMMEPDTEAATIKVLLVEDMALNQLLMKTVLEDFGFECDIAENGKIAIEKLTAMNAVEQTPVYDIILMDLHMPEMNGFDASGFIRNSLKSNIPIIALTADVTTVDLEKCKAAGMNDYLAKPVDEKLLFSKIKSLVKNPLSKKLNAINKPANGHHKNTNVINLDYLKKRTKDNQALVIQMIELYLKQTPPLIITMKQSWKDMDWQLLYGAVHKLIPSFSIVGIPKDFEILANRLQEYARSQSHAPEIPAMILAIENVCTQACTELITELNLLKNNEHEKR